MKTIRTTSANFKGGMVVSNNSSKHHLLGASSDTISIYDAVSEPKVRQELMSTEK